MRPYRLELCLPDNHINYEKDKRTQKYNTKKYKIKVGINIYTLKDY